LAKTHALIVERQCNLIAEWDLLASKLDGQTLLVNSPEKPPREFEKPRTPAANGVRFAWS
jgi:hypothetical protein